MKDEWNWRTRALLVLAGCAMLVVLMFFKEAPASYTMLDGKPPVEPVEEPDCD